MTDWQALQCLSCGRWRVQAPVVGHPGRVGCKCVGEVKVVKFPEAAGTEASRMLLAWWIEAAANQRAREELLHRQALRMSSDLSWWNPDTPAMTPKERKRRMEPTPAGHAWTPGTGPAGQTCGSCQHLVRNQQAKVYLKCGLTRAKWTASRRTDVRARDAACQKWEPAP